MEISPPPSFTMNVEGVDNKHSLCLRYLVFQFCKPKVITILKMEKFFIFKSEVKIAILSYA
jgi:hypothetical protein